jgi:hypothetical protein
VSVFPQLVFLFLWDHVVSKESRRLVLPRSSCKVSIYYVSVGSKYCDVFTGYSDTNLPRVRVSATSN